MILKNRLFQLVISCVFIFFLVWLLIKEKEPTLTRVFIKEKTINVGEVDSDKKVKVKFELINEGEESLIISNVEVSCHCTVPGWEKSPINFNKSTFIEVEYKGDAVGYFQQDILVYCNVKYSPILLTLEGIAINNK